MKTNKKIAFIAIVSILSASPVFSGSWLNECVTYVRDRWSADTNFNRGNPADPVCPIPSDFYTPEYNRGTPTQCTGIRIRGGSCRTETWGWRCETGAQNGYGTVVDIKASCREVSKFYFPCTEIKEVGGYRQIRVECMPK
jgi:hypothetical protein